MTKTHDPRRLVAACEAPGIRAVSHHSAAYLHGLVEDEPRLVHVLTVRGTHPRPPAHVIPHHTRTLDPPELTTAVVEGSHLVPVTTPATTVVMLAAYLGTDELIEAMRRALDGICTGEVLRAAAQRRRRRGRCGPSRVLDALASWPQASAVSSATHDALGA